MSAIRRLVENKAVFGVIMIGLTVLVGPYMCTRFQGGGAYQPSLTIGSQMRPLLKFDGSTSEAKKVALLDAYLRQSIKEDGYRYYPPGDRELLTCAVVMKQLALRDFFFDRWLKETFVINASNPERQQTLLNEGLALAVLNRDDPQIDWFLERGARPDLETNDAVLGSHSWHGDEGLDVIRAAGLNTRFVGKSAVYIAVMRNDIAILRRLFLHLEGAPRGGNRYLLHAIENENVEMARMLLAEGVHADGVILASGVSKQGMPLRRAIERESIELVELLMNFGADPLVKDSRGISPADVARDLGADAIKDAIQNQIDASARNHLSTESAP